MDTHLCTIYKTGGFDVEKEFTVSPEDFYQTIHPDDRAHMVSALNELKDTDRTRCELTCRLNSENEYGISGWIYMQAYKLEAKDGSGSNALQGTMTSLEIPQNDMSGEI